jgi:hypothetical protein
MTLCGMKKTFRYDLGTSIFALGLACAGMQLFLFVSYFGSHPRAPDSARGLIHALNNHGSHVYISDAEWLGLSLLRVVLLLCVIGTMAVLPKDPTRAPFDTPRWVANSFYVAEPGTITSKTRVKAVFFCSIVLYLAAIYLAGPFVVRLLISHGIVLQM